MANSDWALKRETGQNNCEFSRIWSSMRRLILLSGWSTLGRDCAALDCYLLPYCIFIHYWVVGTLAERGTWARYIEQLCAIQQGFETVLMRSRTTATPKSCCSSRLSGFQMKEKKSSERCRTFFSPLRNSECRYSVVLPFPKRGNRGYLQLQIGVSNLRSCKYIVDSFLVAVRVMN